MAAFGEPWEWTLQRQQEALQYFPTLEDFTPDENIDIDMGAFDNGDMPSTFSQSAMGLAGHAAQTKYAAKQDRGFLGKLVDFVSEVDKPLSTRLGFKAEGDGVASSLENIAMEEATRPSNIILSLGGLLTGGLSAGAAGTRVAASAAARMAARNIGMGIGGRIAAAGANEALDYYGVENPTVRSATAIGAGLLGGSIAGGVSNGAMTWARAARMGIQESDDAVRAAAQAELAAKQAAQTAQTQSRYGYLMGTPGFEGTELGIGAAATRGELPQMAELAGMQRPAATRTFPSTSGVNTPSGTGAAAAATALSEEITPEIAAARAAARSAASGGTQFDQQVAANEAAARVIAAQTVKPSVLTWGNMTNKERAMSVLSAPLHVRSSFDLSAPRQIAPYLSGRITKPGEVAKVFTEEAKALGSEQAFANRLMEIKNSPNAKHYADMGLEFSDLNGSREELLSSAALESLPFGIGKGFRMSDRAYSAAVNEARRSLADIFIDQVNKLDPATAQTVLSNPEEMQRLGKFVMAATGRGSLPKFMSENALLGQPIFWAPRLFASRLQIPLTALFTKHSSASGAIVRNEALKELVGMVGVNASMLGALKYMGLADVEMDPRSSDFGQVRVGERRFDTWGGYRPIANLTYRMLINGYNAATGSEVENFKGLSGVSGEGDLYSKDSLAIASDFMKSKFSPQLGALITQLEGKDFTGRRIDSSLGGRAWQLALDLLAPLSIEQIGQEVYSQIPDAVRREGAAGALKSLGGIAASNLVYMNGVGGGYYVPRPADLASMGKYAEMNPDDQLDAIRSMSWFLVRDSLGASNYKSYQSWESALVKEYQRAYTDAGYQPALARQLAQSMVSKMAGTKNFQRISQMYENQWLMDNPEYARKIVNEEYKKPFNERRLSLTQQQMRLIQ